MPDDGVTVWVDFPLVQEITGVPDTGYSPFFFSADGDYLLFRFTDQTFTKVLSALQNGSKTTYPDEAFQTVWEFLRNVEFPVPICDLVAECFANDAEFRQSVIDSLKNDPYFSQTVKNISGRAPEPQIEGKIFGDNCDEDVVAGRIIAIVDKLNTRNVDFLEIVEVGTNDEERVAAVLSAIPVLGESPADEVLNLIQNFIEDFTENYNAAITEDWLAEVYGDLFCIALESDNCDLTFQQVFDYFSARAGSELTIASTLANIFTFIVNGDFATDNLVASGMYLIQLAYILAGQEFNGMSVPKMGAIARDAGTSSAWMDWPACDVPPDENCTDFTSEQGLFSVLDGNTTWENGEGYRGSYYAPIYYVAQIKRSGVDEVVTKITIRSNVAMDEVRLTNQDGSTAYLTYSGTPETEIEFSVVTFPGWTNFNASSGFGFRVQWNSNNPSSRITEACVYTE